MAILPSEHRVHHETETFVVPSVQTRSLTSREVAEDPTEEVASASVVDEEVQGELRGNQR